MPIPLSDAPIQFETSSQQAVAVPVFTGWLGSWQISLARRAHSTAELVQRYDRVSSSWHDTINQLGVVTAYRHLLNRILRQQRYAQMATPLKVLDAGIGTAAMTVALHDIVNVPVELEGVDISPAMLCKAEEQLQNRKIDAQLQEANVQALPFEEERFDIVLAAHVLEHLTDPELAVSELHRVLKPGGLIVLCVTRHSSLGAYIQLKWRTHRVARTSALGWLRRAQFQSVRAVPFERRSIARHLSIGYVGRKPDLVKSNGAS